MKGHGCFYVLAERFLPNAQIKYEDLPEYLRYLERVPAQMSHGPITPLPERAFFPPAYHDEVWRTDWQQCSLPLKFPKILYENIEVQLNSCIDRWSSTQVDLMDAVLNLLLQVRDDHEVSDQVSGWVTFTRR